MNTNFLRRTAAALALGAFATTAALSTTVSVASAGVTQTVAYVNGSGLYVDGTGGTPGRNITVLEGIVTKTILGRRYYYTEMRVEDPKGILAQEGCVQAGPTAVHCGDPANFTRLSVQASFGDDVIDTRTINKQTFAYGHDGKDTIRTGGGNDQINGGLGQDYMDAGNGTDTINGGDTPTRLDWDWCYNANTNLSCEVIG